MHSNNYKHSWELVAWTDLPPLWEDRPGTDFNQMQLGTSNTKELASHLPSLYVK